MTSPSFPVSIFWSFVLLIKGKMHQVAIGSWTLQFCHLAVKKFLFFSHSVTVSAQISIK